MHQRVVLVNDHGVVIWLFVVVVVSVTYVELVIVFAHQLCSLLEHGVLDNCKRNLPLLNMHML